MAIELVTGHAGQGHVSSADAGRLNAGICGVGKYVLDTGLKFAYSIESANLIRIASGDAVNQGRHITIPQNTYEDANILNGAQGKTRIDVITLRYSKVTRQVDSQTVTVEEASVNVIKGTEVAAGSTPEVPAVISGNIFDGTTIDDMPLYHVLITDTSVTSVTPVFKVMPSIDELEQNTDDLHQDILDMIDDQGTGSNSTWSSNKIRTEIDDVIDDQGTGSNATWSSEKIANQVQDDIDDATTWKQLRSTPFSPAGENSWVEIPQTAKEVIVSAHITYTPSTKVSVMFHAPVLPHFFTAGAIYAIVNYYGSTNDGYARLDCSLIDGVKKVRLFALSNGANDVTASCSWDVFYR